MILKWECGPVPLTAEGNAIGFIRDEILKNGWASLSQALLPI
jgi:hypothetical protein